MKINQFVIGFSIIFLSACDSQRNKEQIDVSKPPSPILMLLEGTQDTNYKMVYYVEFRRSTSGIILFPKTKTFKKFHESCLENYSDTGRYDVNDNLLSIYLKKGTLNRHDYFSMSEPGKLKNLIWNGVEFYRSTTFKNRSKILNNKGDGIAMLFSDNGSDSIEYGYYKNFILVNGYRRNNEGHIDTIKFKQ